MAARRHMTVGRVGKARGRARAFGDDNATGAPDPVAQLIAQVNRFGPDAPVAVRFLTATIPAATGTLPLAAAIAAVTIYQRAATDSYNRFHDAGSAAAIAAANKGFADPMSFVMGDIANITAAIAAYADNVGLPASGGLLGGSSLSTVLLVAGVGLAVWWMVR